MSNYKSININGNFSNNKILNSNSNSKEFISNNNTNNTNTKSNLHNTELKDRVANTKNNNNNNFNNFNNTQNLNVNFSNNIFNNTNNINIKNTNQNYNQNNINNQNALNNIGSQSIRITTGGGGDRFIPIRSSSDISNDQLFLMNKNNNNNTNTNNLQEAMFKRLILEKNTSDYNNYCVNTNPNMNMNMNNSNYTNINTNDRLLNFTQRNPALLNSNNLNNNLNTNLKTDINTNNSLLNSIHRISQSCIINKNNLSNFNKYSNITPDKILDSPNLKGEYAFNILDWSISNTLTVALSDTVYLWYGNSNETKELLNSSENISCVKWKNEESILALGYESGNLELWDCIKFSPLRKIIGHSKQITCIQWAGYYMVSASKDGNILIHDVRIKNHMLYVLKGHRDEVYSLSLSSVMGNWSSSYSGNSGSSSSSGIPSMLASSGKDGIVNIFEFSSIENGGGENNVINNSNSNNNISQNINFNGNNRQLLNSMFTNNTNMNNNTNNIINNNNPYNTFNNNINTNNNPNTNTNFNNPYSGINPNNNTNTNNFNLQSNNTITLPNISYSFKVLTPKYSYTHKSKVRALSFCPWQNNLLASGGCSNTDTSIKFYNAETGKQISSYNTSSKICNIKWNSITKELITAHSDSKYEINIWKYPEMHIKGSITQHTNTPFYLAMSPDYTTLVSGSEEERLYFWKIFNDSVGNSGNLVGNGEGNNDENNINSQNIGGNLNSLNFPNNGKSNANTNGYYMINEESNCSNMNSMSNNIR